MPAFDDGQKETELPTTEVVETDVLVVGSGPAGAAAALFCAQLGIDTIMITKYRWTANTPRAHITNQRAMEIFRDMGISDQVLGDATPHELCGDTVDLEPEITGYSLWGVNEMYATHLQAGRVFCAGDAIHRHPPSNGLGSNTSVQDAYNLV